jgi:DNA-binding transcriptional regulator YiaG
MTPQKRDLHSTDPLDSESDPVGSFGGPLDQANANALLHQSPPWIAADEIRAVRERLRLTQRQFAAWFGFPTATLRHWERGNRQPTGSALVLLSVIRDNPRAVIQTVRKARRLRPGSLPEVDPLKSYRAPPGLGERPPPLRRRRARRRS